MTAARIAAALALALPGLVGCFHYRAELPGVLDLRTDASRAAPREEPLDDPYSDRRGFASVLEGSGVETLGTGVVVEDRHYYLLRLFAVYNASPREEVEQALGRDGALRDLSIGDEFAPEDIALASACSLVPGVGALLLTVLPPMTFELRGVRVQAARQPTKGQVKPPPPTDEPLPIPLPVPADPSTGAEGGAS